MKTNPAILQITVLLSATVLFGNAAFSQPAGEQPSPGVQPQDRINPAAGLPTTAGSTAVVDPVTGLPVLVQHTNSALDLESSVPVLDEARELMHRGRYEEALQCYLGYGTQARESGTAARLVLALSDWVELGRRYPKAKQALINLRDHDTREFVEGRGDFKLFQELAGINDALGAGDATYALFKGIEQSDPPLAEDCYFVMEAALVERGEYALCARYLGNPQVRFDSARHLFGMEQGFAQQDAESAQKMAQKSAEFFQTNGWPQPDLPVNNASGSLRRSSADRFVLKVGQLIEILVGTGRKPEAEKILDQAIATLNDARFQSAVSDAEERVRAIRASPRPEPAPIKIHPQFAESLTLFSTNPAAPSASVERWAPALESGTKSDLQKILSDAKEFAARNQYEESLQRHLWYHNHALELDPAQRGVRLSFALSDWAELGRKYPKARQALLEIRDRDLREFAEGRGSADRFKDIAAIDEQWAFDRTTCQLFKFVQEQDPGLAKRCYGLAEDARVQHGEYALCLGYVGDGQAKFGKIRQEWDKRKQSEDHVAQIQEQAQKRMDEYWTQKGQKRPAMIPSIETPRVADEFFVGKTRQLIQILVGAGHQADAEKIRDQAVAVLDDPRLKSAVSDAEEKIQKRSLSTVNK